MNRGFLNTDRVIAFLAKDSGTPFIHLSNYEVQQETFSLLPLDFMVQQGAMVFEKMSDDLLVALLNPYNTELKKEVEGFTKRTCHFYLVDPEQYDKVLADIQKAAASFTEE